MSRAETFLFLDMVVQALDGLSQVYNGLDNCLITAASQVFISYIFMMFPVRWLSQQIVQRLLAVLTFAHRTLLSAEECANVSLPAEG